MSARRKQKTRLHAQRRAKRRPLQPLRRNNAQPTTEAEEQDQQQAFRVLNDMRRQQLSLRKAAAANGTTPEMVVRYVGSALRRTSNGRIRASKHDRIPKTVNVLTAQGPEWVTVRDSRTASRIGEHRSKVREWRRSRNGEVLKPFEGLSFRAGGRSYRFVTDSETLNQLDDADLLALETLYRSVQAMSA